MVPSASSTRPAASTSAPRPSHRKNGCMPGARFTHPERVQKRLARLSMHAAAAAVAGPAGIELAPLPPAADLHLSNGFWALAT